MPRSKQRVVITGIGLVTPLGSDTQTTWNNLVAGKSGITDISQHKDLGQYPFHIGGLVTGEQEKLDQIISKKFQEKTDRFIHLTLLAGHEAMTDAGLTKDFPADRHRFGCYMGVSIGGLAGIEETILSAQQKGLKRVSPFAIPKILNNLSSGWLSMEWNLQGPALAVSNACSSSADSLGFAFRMIRDGYADYMLAGGVESCVLPIAVAGFGNMRALSSWQGDPTKASRPFSKDRSGFVMSEGGALMVLERYDKAVERGAKIYAEVTGYGSTADAHHITAMHPEGRGAIKALEMALDDAGVCPADIGYLNAHGTSTPMGDERETMVIKKVFGLFDGAHQGKLNNLLVSSTKSMTGHMLGAAGAAEAAFCALSLKHQLVLPTINLDVPDPACDLDYVPHTSRKHSFDYAVSNSFGFGGGNAVLVLKKVV